MTVDSSSQPPPPTPRPTASPGRLIAALVLLLLAVAAWRTLDPLREDQRAPSVPDSTAGTVVLSVVQPDAPVEEAEIPWTPGQTVADATRQAFDTRWRGSGEMALLEEIDGVPNQGPDGLNWQFEVNDDYATRGAGALELRAGDHVLWKLAPYE